MNVVLEPGISGESGVDVSRTLNMLSEVAYTTQGTSLNLIKVDAGDMVIEPTSAPEGWSVAETDHTLTFTRDPSSDPTLPIPEVVDVSTSTTELGAYTVTAGINGLQSMGRVGKFYGWATAWEDTAMGLDSDSHLWSATGEGGVTDHGVLGAVADRPGVAIGHGAVAYLSKVASGSYKWRVRVFEPHTDVEIAIAAPVQSWKDTSAAMSSDTELVVSVFDVNLTAFYSVDLTDPTAPVVSGPVTDFGRYAPLVYDPNLGGVATVSLTLGTYLTIAAGSGPAYVTTVLDAGGVTVADDNVCHLAVLVNDPSLVFPDATTLFVATNADRGSAFVARTQADTTIASEHEITDGQFIVASVAGSPADINTVMATLQSDIPPFNYMAFMQADIRDLTGSDSFGDIPGFVQNNSTKPLTAQLSTNRGVVSYGTSNPDSDVTANNHAAIGQYSGEASLSRFMFNANTEPMATIPANLDTSAPVANFVTTDPDVVVPLLSGLAIAVFLIAILLGMLYA